MKAQGKKFVSLFLIFSLLVLTGNLIAKEKRGAELVVQKRDGKQLKGELIAVKENSLLLFVSGKDITIDIEDVKFIEIEKSRNLAGAGLGILIGGGIGALIGYATSPSAMWPLGDTRPIGALAFGAIGATVGFIVGGILSSKKNELIQIEGKSPEEVKEALEYLRKKARIPDYK